MARPNKKLSVSPELRKKWLQRHDEDGESTPQIADKDGYDVRTVRKQLEIARQEREMRESRLMVLREAVQSHYQDLCRSAQQIDDTVTAGNSITGLMAERKYAALRQHLQYAPLWKRLDKWNSCYIDRLKAFQDLRKEIGNRLAKDPDLNGAFASGKEEISGMVEIFANQSLQWSHGIHFNIDDWFKTNHGENGLLNLQLGAYYIGTVAQAQAPKVKESLASFAKKITGFDTYKKYQELGEQMKQLEPDVHEDLATITLKRVVPGRCKYCPA